MTDSVMRRLLPKDYPQRRYNPLLAEWVLVSAHRSRRPWLGQAEAQAVSVRQPYDPGCYLCPGNARAGGHRNPAYQTTFVFTNDFASVLPDTPKLEGAPHPLLRWKNSPGTCRVICYSPRHDLTLAEMPVAEVRGVIDVWASQVAELGAIYQWVQVFENKGEVMGCSNPHPHGQIWATEALPSIPSKEQQEQADYLAAHGAPMLVEYGALEMRQAERVVLSNAHWLAIVPFWAVWPFETLLLPRREPRRLPDLDDGERDSLAHLLSRLLTKYDNLFGVSFPYSMGWHGAPTDDSAHTEWLLHAHVYPPLLRSASIKKFMVGYEMLAEAQRDLTPEQAAERLRSLSEFRAPR